MKLKQVSVISEFWIAVCVPLLVAAPTLYALDLSDEAAKSREFQAGQPEQVRTITRQPGVEQVEVRAEAKLVLPTRDEGLGQLLWSAADDAAIADHVAISANGSWVAIGYTLNDERLEVRNASDGELEFVYPVASGGCWVAISANGRMIAFSALDSVWVFSRDLGAQPFMRFGMAGFGAGPVAISADGAKLIATGIDPDGRSNRIWGFEVQQGVGNPLWTRDVNARESFYWYGANITPDGAVGVVNGKFRLFVLNAENGDLIWEAPTYNTESPTAISDDGAILVSCSLSGRVRVFAPSGDGYSELWHYNFSGAVASWISACAISGDGRTVAAGTLDFLQNNGVQGRLAVFDTFGGGRPDWTSDPLSDIVGSISISQDGGIIAATSWGDVENQRPDLVIHERHNRQPFYRLTTQGSLDAVAIARDGTKAVAAGKAVHDRVFGNGGQVHSVDLVLRGAMVNGLVRVEGGGALQGVQVSASNNPYHVVTDRQGRYALRVEAPEEREVTISVRKPGFSFASQAVGVGPDQEINDIDFSLIQADNPPQNVRATQGGRNQIAISWTPYNGRQEAPSRSNPQSFNSSLAAISATLYDEPVPIPRRDDPDDADSIRIYRSYLPGGPFMHIGSVVGDLSRFVDPSGVLPGHRYYYTTTAIFGNAESTYANETTGWVDDRFLIWQADLQSMPAAPNLDGMIDEDEWEGAEVRDISDVLGYDAPDSAGTVIARIGFSDEDDRLYLAFSYFGLRALQDRAGVGVYVDDNGDQQWSVERLGSEGNYWGNFTNGVPEMRYRSLSGNPYAVPPYYTFEDPPLAFSDDRGYVEIEMAIPLGFHGPQEIELKSPEKVIGLGLFALQHDQAGNNVFNGWWPQDIFSIVANTEQFARVHIPADLIVPPATPNDVRLARDGDALALDWVDPDTAVDGTALEEWDGVGIYRNGTLLTRVQRGQQQYIDESVELGGWYEYSLAAYVQEQAGPFEGPKSAPVGLYASSEPRVVELSFDDGRPDMFPIIDVDGRDNRFATRFDVAGGGDDTAGIFWVDLYHDGAAPINVYIMSDDQGYPDSPFGRRLEVWTNSETGFQRFHFPGVTQPRFAVDFDAGASVWAVMNYLPDTPFSPLLGVDESAKDDSRNMYHTAERGWLPFALGQPMIRVGVGTPPPISVENEPRPLPDVLLVMPNYPNPFNGVTSLPFALPGQSVVSFTLFDVCGRVVWIGSPTIYGAGSHTIPLFLASLPSGAYRLEVKSDFGSASGNLRLLK